MDFEAPNRREITAFIRLEVCVESNSLVDHPKTSSNGEVTNGKSHKIIVTDPEVRAQGTLTIQMARFVLESRRGPEFIDISDIVQDLIAKSGIKEGSVLVYSRHTTAGIVIQENEPLLIQDMYKRLEKIAHAGEEYQHNDFDIRTVNMCDDECANGHAHCQHLFIGSSLQLPILGGHIALGQWQRLFFLELDRPRSREVMVQLTGI
jgi:secondary thiamine-phosphate synthase enzyme